MGNVETEIQRRIEAQIGALVVQGIVAAVKEDALTARIRELESAAQLAKNGNGQ